jgi:5-methyltetrahydropteroyltriglutamate--homocysteine methyltransferase
MIEYFVRPMSGIRHDMSFDEVMAYRAMPGMRFRTRPPGVVDGAGRQRHARPARRLPARLGAGDPDLQVHRQPARTCWPRHCSTALPHHRGAGPRLADVLAEQVKFLDADVVQIDEANLPGHPEEWEWARQR